MTKPVLFAAVFLGTCAGALSYFLLEGMGHLPYWTPAVLIPGMILGIIASGNVHAFSTWATVAGNFLFYFGLVYFTNAIRARFSRR
jgi:hypothetical protein